MNNPAFLIGFFGLLKQDQIEITTASWP